MWGGEVADLDGDGRPEMFLRSAQASLFKVFEAVGDDRFAEVAALPNSTSGNNELGERQVVADLDGDGQGEILCGDGDGDLFVYEGIADNAWRSTWREEEYRAHTDARVVGGGVDLDGDGWVEFVVARLFQDPFAPEQTHWQVMVYQSAGDNAYAPEWQVEVLGGKASGNGIATADLDGDGQVEFALALVPHLYVFQATGPDAYTPVWHAPARDTHRPAAGDLDGDGQLELVFNTAGKVRSYSLQERGDFLPAPSGFVAYARDRKRIVLEWRPVAGAGGYRVYRDDEIRGEEIEETRFEDPVPEAGKTYHYSVAAVDADSQVEGGRTAALAVRSEDPPRVVEVTRLSPFQLAVSFDASMDLSYETSYYYRVEPGVGLPSSVFPDQSARRVVLSFAAALPDSGRFTLELGQVRSRAGTLLAADSRQVEFFLQAYQEPARPLGAEARTATQVVLDFSRPVVLPPDPLAVFTFADSSLQIRQVWSEGVGAVVLELDETTPLQPLGRRYQILIHGLSDDAGHWIESRVSVHFAAADLEAVRVFPNPFHPDRGALTFGGLTPDSQVYLHDLAGQLVQVLAEENQDGGVHWNGLNAAGKPVQSGVYFFRVVSGTQIRAGKFVLLRE